MPVPGDFPLNHNLDREVIMVTNGRIVRMNMEVITDRNSLTLPSEIV